MLRFFEDMLQLLIWSFFQPRQLETYLPTLHPSLTIHTGFIQQLVLAARHSTARRFVMMELIAWLILGLMSTLTISVVRLSMNSFEMILIWEAYAFDLIFGIVGTLTVAWTLTVIGGVSVGLAGAIAASLLLGLSLGLSLGLAAGSTAGIALGLTGSMILGTIGSIFDRLRRPTQRLSSWSYWGRASVGFLATAISTILFGVTLAIVIFVADVLINSLLIRLILGAGLGLLAALLLHLTFRVTMPFEVGEVDGPRLRWHTLDILLMCIVGGVAGAFVISATPGVFGAFALMILWGVLMGGGGGLALHAGNGVSTVLAAAGLTWLLVAGLTNPFALTTMLAVGVALLVGLFSYVRLPIMMVQIPFTRLQYIFASRDPDQTLARLKRTPVYWDDLVFYPLPALDQLLLKALLLDRQQGLEAVDFISHSFRQGWAANQARLAFAVETLTNCTSPQMIAEAPNELEWLADEVLQTLQHHTVEMIPRLLGIAGGVQTTLNADNLYSQRLGYREVLDGLDTLQGRLPSLGEQAVEWWQPVISQWQRVLLDELDDILAMTPQSTTVANPYQPGNPLPLNRKNLFKGRQELRDAVVNALLERHRPTLVLHGPRRMGKTSFLLQLPALLPGNTVPVFLDLQRPTTTQSTAAFLYSIARAIAQHARPYRLLLDPPQRNEFEVSPFEAFATWLEDIALPALQDFNVLLTFDEFEKLGEAVQAERLDTRIFDELRYLIQHQTQLALLFAGVQTLDELGPAWSSYFINVKPLTIDYLEAEQAEAVIRQPDTTVDFALQYEDHVVEQVIQQTQGHPYLLQLLCSSIVDEANAQKQVHVNTTTFEAALPRALEQGEPYFRNVWDEMAGETGQPLLYQIATSTHPVSLPESSDLTRLLRRRVIRREDEGYLVEIPLVQRWIVERAPV